MLALLAVLALQSAETVRAESLLAAGALRDARAVAERLVRQSPQDPAAHLALGRVWLAWPTVGRYEALSQFRTAGRLAPNDPEPRYDVMRVGFYLGSDEGEVMARNAILEIFALDPDYRDTWSRFQELFRNESIWRKADRALARHPEHARALERRAGIAIALGEPARAESLAVLAQERGGRSAALFLTRAEAAFLAGRDSAGQLLHDSAIAYSGLDTTQALWSRAALIASPEEVERYGSINPGDRPAFFADFWGARDPNLLTVVNERIGEQVRRAAEARRQFRLLHPQRMWYRSADYRALGWFDQQRWLFEVAQQAPAAVGEGLSSTRGAVARLAALNYQSFQDSAATLAYRAGLDARGLLFVRHGAPQMRVACAPDPRYAASIPRCTSFLDAEGWLYATPEGVFSIAFKGAEYFAPVSRSQLRSVRELLRTDRSTLPAPLEARAAVAFFRGKSPSHADAYYRVSGDSAAVALWSPDGRERARVEGKDLLAVKIVAGEYRFGLDIDSAGILGRARGAVSVPWFDSGELKVSSLVLAADSLATDRESVLRAMPVELAFASGAPLAIYAEVYGLAPAARGRLHYRARYSFAPERSLLGRLLRGADPVSFEFERDARDAAVVPERLRLEPGRVPPGRYRVTLAVTDLVQNVKSETVALVVTIR